MNVNVFTIECWLKDEEDIVKLSDEKTIQGKCKNVKQRS